MKKLFSILIVIVLLAFGGSYYFIGGKAETDFKRSIEQFNLAMKEQMAGGPTMNFTLENYRRGVIRSTASLRISMDINAGMSGHNRPAFKMPRMDYALKLNINHGPFIFSKQKFALAYAESRLTVPEQYKKMASMMLEKESTLPELAVGFLLNFDQSGRLSVTVPAFKIFPRGQKGELIWDGFESVYDVSKDRNKLSGYTRLNGMKIDSPQVQAEMGKLTMDYDLNRSPHGLWLGKASFNFPSLDVEARGQKIFALEGFKMTSDTNVTTDLLNISMVSSLAKIVIKGADYGPGALEFAIKQIDAKTFVDLQHRMQAINRPEYSDRQKKQMIVAMLPEVLKLFAKGATFELTKFSVKLPQGTVEANGSVSVPTNSTFKSAVELAGKLKANIHLRVPEVLVKRLMVSQAEQSIRRAQMRLRMNSDHDSVVTPSDSGTDPENKLLSSDQIVKLANQKSDKQLEKLVSSHVLVKEGSDYKVDVSFDQGHLLVNGKPFSPELLKQP